MCCARDRLLGRLDREGRSAAITAALDASAELFEASGIVTSGKIWFDLRAPQLRRGQTTGQTRADALTRDPRDTDTTVCMNGQACCSPAGPPPAARIPRRHYLHGTSQPEKCAACAAEELRRRAAEIAAAAEAERMKRKDAEAEMQAERKARLVAEQQTSRASDSYADLERKFQAFVLKVQDQTHREVEAAVNAAEARTREDTERQLREALELKLRAEVKMHAESSAKAFSSVAD
eukprot:SAG22_NODE_4186_length_1353_cov_1.803828_1_plen_234_part_10